MLSGPARLFQAVQAGELLGLLPETVHAVFARHVAAKAPSSTALWCAETGEWALGGSLSGLPEVPDLWALVRHPSRLATLAEELGQRDANDGVALVQPFSEAMVSAPAIDRHYVRTAPRARDHSTQGVRPLCMEDFETQVLHEEISALLGRPQLLIEDFGGLSQFMVCEVGGMVVAVADAVVQHGPHAAIQQVYTAQAFRRRGIASALVARLGDQISAQGRVALYVCDASNQASSATAERAGFNFAASLPCFPSGLRAAQPPGCESSAACKR